MSFIRLILSERKYHPELCLASRSTIDRCGRRFPPPGNGKWRSPRSGPARCLLTSFRPRPLFTATRSWHTPFPQIARAFSERKGVNTIRENPRRYLILLISLLLIFVLSPIIVTFRHGPTILNIVGAAVLLSATYAVSERQNFLIVALLLSAFSIITTFCLFAAPSHWAVIVSH